MAVEAGKSIRVQRFEDTGENPCSSAGVLVLLANESWNENPFGGYVKRTEYTGWAADTRKTSRPFMEHWMQRISTATVRGNARRALNALSALAFRFS